MISGFGTFFMPCQKGHRQTGHDMIVRMERLARCCRSLGTFRDTHQVAVSFRYLLGYARLNGRPTELTSATGI